MKFCLVFVLILAGSIGSAAAMTLELQVEDPKNLLGDRRDLVIQNIHAAFREWANFIRSDSTLIGKLKIETTSTGRAAAASTSNIAIDTFLGRKVLEESAVHKIRTGKSVKPGEPDLIIQIDPIYMVKEMWLDPRPTVRRDPVPRDKLDAVTVFSHEFGHA